MYILTNDQKMCCINAVKFDSWELPSSGDLTNENDRDIIESLEDKMIEVYGDALVWFEVERANPDNGGDGVCNFDGKMIRPEHLKTLGAALKVREGLLCYLPHATSCSSVALQYLAVKSDHGCEIMTWNFDPNFGIRCRALAQGKPSRDNGGPDVLPALGEGLLSARLGIKYRHSFVLVEILINIISSFW